MASVLYMGYPIIALSPFEQILSSVFTETLKLSTESLVPVIEVETVLGSALCAGLDFSAYLALRFSVFCFLFCFFLAWLCGNFLFVCFGYILLITSKCL